MIDAGDPAPVTCCNPHGRSPFLLVGDHAGNAIPRALGTLGLAAADRNRHIAWDIGAAVRFLLSEQARYITGQILGVDGGATLVGPSRAS